MPNKTSKDVGAALDSRNRILSTVDCIPPGHVASYGQVAAEAGLPRRARLVGRVLAQLKSGNDLPWHRVVNAAGKLSVNSSAAGKQRKRLEGEGVEFSASGRIDLARFGWRP